MRIVKTVAAMQRLALRWRSEGVRIGFVPTMGYLHEGHLSLVHEARKRVGPEGRVVVSIYVNPTQFGPHEDLTRYPRDFARDRRLCAGAGADVVFFPDDSQMYPGRDTGCYSTYVVEERLSTGMEGVIRPGHFRGVTTIVAKLFNVVLPTVAVFGSKDFQQAAVIRRMARDLNFPIRIVVAPTRREPDGLAMSSRNKYLDESARARAIVLWEAIQRARREVTAVPAGVRTAALVARLTRWIEERSGGKVDYLAFFDPDTLEPVPQARRGHQFALAVRFGPVRLIDNARL